MAARYAWPGNPSTFIPRPMARRTKTEVFEITALVLLRCIVMMRRAIPTFVALIALSQTATAGVPLFGHVSCAVVRFYVAKYSEAAAEKWARGHGASETDIETARRCLHNANVQTAARRPDDRPSQVLAPVEQERAQREPANRDPDQDAGLQVVSVQGQRADPEQTSHDDEPGVHGLIRPKDIEDRPAEHVSYQTKDDLAPSGVRTTTSHVRSVSAMHRAYKMGVTAWLKRQWDYLVGRRRSSIALFAFPRSRSYRRPWHHLSGTVPGHAAG